MMMMMMMTVVMGWYNEEKNKKRQISTVWRREEVGFQMVKEQPVATFTVAVRVLGHTS